MIKVDKLSTRNYHRKKTAEAFIHFAKMYSHLWVVFGQDMLERDFIKHIFLPTGFVLT